MPGIKLEQWEQRLRVAFDAVDATLEDKYGGDYPLHPSRPRRGATANSKYDGLFSVGAAYSAGFGSKHGEGYILEVRMVTLSNVPKKIRHAIYEEVVGLLQQELPNAFPDREMDVIKDGKVYKIIGNLDLE